jgi:anti-anti-sigma factor
MGAWAVSGPAAQDRKRGRAANHSSGPGTRSTADVAKGMLLSGFMADLTGEERRVEDLLVAALAGGHVYADRNLVVSRTRVPYGLRFIGEIDATNAHAVEESLVGPSAEAADVHLDLTALIFCDISGIRALVRAAENLNEGRLLKLHGLPAQLQTVMKATGWADLPSLAICTCGDEA